jgi:hypothetical protein
MKEIQRGRPSFILSRNQVDFLSPKQHQGFLMETDNYKKRQIQSIVKWIRSTWDKLMRCSIQLLDLVVFIEFHSVSNSRQVLREWERELGVKLLFFFMGSSADMPASRRME